MNWDERYAVEEYVYGTQPNDFLAANFQHIAPGRVLSLCEGEGRNAVFLATHGYQVTAVDASATGLAKAEKLAAQQQVIINTVVSDLAHYNITADSWHGIVSIFCHIPPDIRKRIYAQIVSGLYPGGVLLLEAYTPQQLEFKTGGPPVADLMLTLQQARAELEGLDFIIAQEIQRPVIEGRYHTGMGAVVQIVARKPN